MFDIKEEAKKLLSQMTLEEKASQMLHCSPAIKRLNIPAYNWWNEALHGVARAGTATVFPQAIALAAAFDTEMLYKAADIISTEGRAKYHAFSDSGDRDIYKGLTFWSPNINIFRDPRWGRGHETYGEDPYLTSQMGAAFIKGLQGGDRNSLKTAACAKHFAVHSGPESQRHSFNAVVDDYDLWNTYLAAFETAVTEAGVEGVMGAYNRTNGEPCCGSKTLLTDILRGKWGFDGYVPSDCWAVKDFHEAHMVTATAVDSAALAVSNGCDVNCGTMFGYVLSAVSEGKLTEEQIDAAVLHLITCRMRLGMLGAPEIKKYANIPYEAVDCKEHNEFNLEAARSGIVLLKNDGTLPLSFEKYKTIGVIGPNANSRRSLDGNYQGTASRYITTLEGITQAADENGARVIYSEGCHLYKDRTNWLSLSDDRMSEAVITAKHSDIIILCMGLDSDLEGEEGDAGNEFSSGDKLNLDLPGRQQALLEAVKKAAGEKPVILVLMSGSALSVTWADKNLNGIVQAFYPGSRGGTAIADILFGKVSPSGKLPVTFYNSTEDLPDFCDYSMENRTYRYFKGDVLYPFGFGLTYSEFSVDDFSLSGDKKAVSVTVTNKGSISASEVIQIYAENSELKELRSLVGFSKVRLSAGETSAIIIPLSKNAFSRYDKNGDLIIINGTYKLSAGFCQPDDRSVGLYGVKPLEITVSL